MTLLEKYKRAKEDLFQSMNIPEAWAHCAIDDHTDVIWEIIGTELWFGVDDTDEYSNECRSIIFKGEEMSAVAVRNDCSREIYLMVLSNRNEQI
jgi:hypothetical protein